MTGRLVGVIVLVWLLIGAFAAYQRGYFGSGANSCVKAATVAATVVAGPLNYAGVNPKVSCVVPKPSQ
jgi:hypothetical protein